MKVKIALKKDTIVCVSEMLNKIYDLPVSNLQIENIYKSICYDLADKFDSKAKSLKKSADLLNADKKHQITLKFHEAWALHMIICDLLQIIPLQEYYQNLISQLLHNLHQKTI